MDSPTSLARQQLRETGRLGMILTRDKQSDRVFDHHFVEYEYEGGVKHWAQARQQGGTWQEVSDNAKGTKGKLPLDPALTVKEVAATVTHTSGLRIIRTNRNTSICCR